MSLQMTLQERLTAGGFEEKYPAATTAAARATAAYEQLRAKRDAISGHPDLNENGKRKEMRKVVSETINQVESSRRAVERGRAAVAARRAELRPEPIDKSNVADAMLHVMLGQRLGEVPQGEQAQLLFGDQVDVRVLAAALELPQVLTRVTPELRTRAEQVHLERNFRPLLAQIEDEGAAWELADAATRTATYEIYEVGGFSSQHEFANWVKATATPDQKQLHREAEESAKLEAEGVFGQALKIPVGERIALVSKLMEANTKEVVGRT